MQDNKLVKALIVDAQQGNNSAFGQLYQITIDSVYALMLRLTGDVSQSEDLTKKTYVNAWQQISEKDESTTVLVWLKKIAIETYLSNFSDNSQSGKESSIGEKSDNETLEKIYTKYPLDKYLLELEHRNKLIFILHDIENLTYSEIENFLKIPVQEIKDLLVSSREKLISLLKL